MTDPVGDLLKGMGVINPPLCSHCDSEPAFIRVDERTVACPKCWTDIAQAIGFPDVTPANGSGAAA